MKTYRTLVSLLLIILFSHTLFAESKPTVNIALGYGYLLNDTPKYLSDTTNYYLYTKLRPAISLDFNQHHLKIDYQSFGFEQTTFEAEISDELTSWNVKDLSLKYGQTIAGKNMLKLAVFAGAGLLIWERKYQKMYPQEKKTNYHPTLPTEIELSYAFQQSMKIGVYLFSDFNTEAKIMGAGVCLYHKLL